MRLTADLIHNSLSYLNPLLERELDLRGHKIPMIENLGVARDQDCIDLTDNVLPSLSNIPLSPRLQTLLLAHNRITTLSSSLSTSAPNLTSLVLTANRITHLSDIDVLGRLRKLTSLVLLDNPVTREKHYRHWIIWRCPSVRFLDFQRVRLAEREKGYELFGEDEKNMTALAKEIAGKKSAAALGGGGGGANGSLVDREGGAGGRVKLTAKERKKVEAMIRNAKSLGEIERLERELNEGRVPGGVVEDSDSDEDMEE